MMASPCNAHAPYGQQRGQRSLRGSRIGALRGAYPTARLHRPRSLALSQQLGDGLLALDTVDYAASIGLRPCAAYSHIWAHGALVEASVLRVAHIRDLQVLACVPLSRCVHTPGGQGVRRRIRAETTRGYSRLGCRCARLGPMHTCTEMSSRPCASSSSAASVLAAPFFLQYLLRQHRRQQSAGR